MYSNEIDNYLKEKNYYLQTYDELFDIQQCSPQISRIKIENIENRYSKYYVQTDDGYFWFINIANYNVDRNE